MVAGMHEAPAQAQGIHAVVVTYRPESAALERLLAALRDMVNSVILIDNASPEWDPWSLAGKNASVTIERLPTNAGIAAAQNRGIALARARDATYVLLLDQDSTPTSGMVSALLGAKDQLTREGSRVACVGSRHRMRGDDRLSSFETYGWLGPRHQICRDAATAVECDTLIASGTLIPVEVIDEVGGMDESLFVDLVDTEWCFRARSKGYRVFGACGAVLEHRLGESTRRLWLGRWRRVPRHQAFRYYFIFRNTLLVARRRYVPWRWILYYLRWLATLFIVCGVFSGTGSGQLRMMLKGTVDGMRGVTGKGGAL